MEEINLHNNCYIAYYDAEDIAGKIKLTFDDGNRTDGRDMLQDKRLELTQITERLIQIYYEVTQTKNKKND